MHYHTYNTLGLILGSSPSGESSRYLYIFTKELGLVGVHGQNIRSVNSKLRYALDAPARSYVSLVRGKNMWRLVSATPDKRFFSVFENQPEKLALCVRIFSVLKKLLAGEETNQELFLLVNNFLDFLMSDMTDLVGESIGDLRDIEAILMLRILHRLGYVPTSTIAEQFAYGTEWNAEIVSAMTPHRKEAIKIINASLNASDL